MECIAYKIKEIISEANEIIIVTHDRADGDGLGSMLALGRAISSECNKNVKCVIFDELAPRYAFLADLAEDMLFVLGKNIFTEDLLKSDVLFVLDTAVREQLEPIAQCLMGFEGNTIIIDHHSHYELPVTPEFILQDSEVSATGILISRLLERWDWLRGSELAEYLLLAIGSDTGWFRYSNTDEECFLWAGRFLKMGADNHRLYEKLFLSDSPERFKLLGMALNSAEFYADNRIVALTLREEDFQRANASQADTENIIDEACRIKSIEVAILFVEQRELGKTRVSLRSKSDIDMNRFAHRFGGGGHPKAAGIKLDYTIEESKRIIIQALEDILSGVKHQEI